MLTIWDNGEFIKRVACFMYPLLSALCLSALPWHWACLQLLVPQEECAPTTLLETEGL